MKTTIKHLLFDSQVANAQTAKKEQLLVMAVGLILVVVILGLHVLQ